MDASPDGRLPLGDVTVVDCTVTLPGPYASSLLARMGARVIKVEPPEGDPCRSFPDVFASLNAAKESFVADLKVPEDQRAVRELAAVADVFIEGWRPGVAARLGVGYEDVARANPSIVYCSISGYGAVGPFRDRAGHDINYVAASGAAAMLFPDRDDIRTLGMPIADLSGGTMAAFRIAAALAGRGSAGGCFVDASLVGALEDWTRMIGGTAVANPFEALSSMPHYGYFPTADDHVISLGIAYEENFWVRLCNALGLSQLGALSFPERSERTDDLRSEIAFAIKARTRPELEQVLADVDTCWAFVEHPGQRESASALSACEQPAPVLGEHTEALRCETYSAREDA